jgi:hypothetical protein
MAIDAIRAEEPFWPLHKFMSVELVLNLKKDLKIETGLKCAQ